MTVKVTKPEVNLREELAGLKLEKGVAGLELLKAETDADVLESIDFSKGVVEDFESTGIDDNATSTKLTTTSTGIDVTGTVTADELNLPDGSTSSRAAKSCLAILHAKPDATDGTYWVHGSDDVPHEVYCDMTTDGGGWTLLLQYNSGKSSLTTDYGASWSTYANHEVYVKGSEVDNASKNCLNGVFTLDNTSRIESKRSWGDWALPEQYTDPFTPGNINYFANAANGEYLALNQYYQYCGASGWQGIGTGYQEVYVREPDKTLKHGEIRTYNERMLTYNKIDNKWEASWLDQPSAYWGELQLQSAVLGSHTILFDNNKEIYVNNGNNGPSARAKMKGVLSGQFKVEFELGYVWGWSNLILKDTDYFDYQGNWTGGNNNLLMIRNNNSNNDCSMTVYDSAGNQSSYNFGSGYSSGTFKVWRNSDNHIIWSTPDGSTWDSGKYAGNFVVLSGVQSPHRTKLLNVSHQHEDDAQ